MKARHSILLVIVCLSFAINFAAHGFALLGPFASWQTPQLGYYSFGQEVGGPQDIDEEYRWNVPVITWGVDQGFMDYFGTNGVRAVSGAFAILNGLPAASPLNPDDFPTEPRRFNARAGATNLIDLKSTVFSLMLEQLGLAAPERYVWTLRDRRFDFVGDLGQYVTNYLVINRNFDPLTFEPSSYVNDVRYSYEVLEYRLPQFGDVADAVEYSVEQADSLSTAASFATSQSPAPGVYLTNLSRDDAGGLRYLHHPSNVNIEPLIWAASPGGQGNEGSVMAGEAPRPGIDKIEFLQAAGWNMTSGWSMTLEWTDRYYTLDGLKEQRLKRVINRPDILITAGDAGTHPYSVQPRLLIKSGPNFLRASNIQSQGPGILQGPVTITLAKLAPAYVNRYPGHTGEASAETSGVRWGSFDSSSEIVIYPQRSILSQVRLHIARDPDMSGTVWVSLENSGSGTSNVSIESSTDLLLWTSTGIVLNGGNGFAAAVSISAGGTFLRGVRVP